nr:glycosyltransferase family 4 protein [Motiliproteus sediminis]
MVLKGYPRLSETFIAQEIRQLELRGMALLIVSLRHPTDSARHPIHHEIAAPVLYLPEYLHQEPLRVLLALARALFRRTFWRDLPLWWRDWRRDPSRNRLRRFGQALVLARELPSSIKHLYAHFIHTPASVTRYCARLTAHPWSASAHAKDIWTLEPWELSEKLAELEWLVTCTRANRDYLATLAPEPERIGLVYHGLDFSRFPMPPTAAASTADGQNTTVRLISVGRAVPKKGYDDLLNALAQLPAGLKWTLTHIGGGELSQSLQRLAEELGLSDRVTWLGAQPQEQVLAAYRQADLFVLASRVHGDGDRDGLPNVLMEAQSQHLACLSTDLSGIPELITHAETGWLVPQHDPVALASALAQLIRQPQLRQQLAVAGYQRVREQFAVDRGIDQLLQRFGPDLVTTPALCEGQE